MNEKKTIEGAVDVPNHESGLPHDGIQADVARGVGDAATIPKGEIDPVYEAKARVLNRAACYKPTTWSHPYCDETDHRPRYLTSGWDGINGLFDSSFQHSSMRTSS